VGALARHGRARACRRFHSGSSAGRAFGGYSLSWTSSQKFKTPWANPLTKSGLLVRCSQLSTPPPVEHNRHDPDGEAAVQRLSPAARLADYEVQTHDRAPGGDTWAAGGFLLRP
jgi:hypothetical protein